MSLVARFLVYNLLLSLAAGLLAWLIVIVALRLMRIDSSVQGLTLLSLPLFKSFLIMLGIGLVFPWPGRLFESWHRPALTFWQVLPFLLSWAVVVYLGFRLAVRSARQAVLKDARPAAEAAPRLEAVFTTVTQAFEHVPCPTCNDDICCVFPQDKAPALLVSERLDSPIALTDFGEPVILFPAGLVPLLNDAELAGALAHELAHFVLRRPNWCSAGSLQKLTLLAPLTGLVSHYLHRQEEKACDALAIAVTGEPELYAGMLTKCYRYASGQKEPAWQHMQLLPRLLGFKPLLSERVEHILSAGTISGIEKRSPVVFWLVWALLFAVLFMSWPV